MGAKNAALFNRIKWHAYLPMQQQQPRRLRAAVFILKLHLPEQPAAAMPR
jgi:hypothetical protein